MGRKRWRLRSGRQISSQQLRWSDREEGEESQQTSGVAGKKENVEQGHQDLLVRCVLRVLGMRRKGTLVLG